MPEGGQGPPQPSLPKSFRPCVPPPSIVSFGGICSGRSRRDAGISKRTQWTQSPRGASGSLTIRASEAVRSGTPVQKRAGETSFPSQVYCRGMRPPFSNAVLLRRNCGMGKATTSLLGGQRVRNAHLTPFLLVVFPLFERPLAVGRRRGCPPVVLALGSLLGLLFRLLLCLGHPLHSSPRRLLHDQDAVHSGVLLGVAAAIVVRAAEGIKAPLGGLERDVVDDEVGLAARDADGARQ